MGLPPRTRVTLSNDGGRRREFCLSRRTALLLAALMLVLCLVLGLLVAEGLTSRDQRATIAELQKQLAAARLEVLSTHALRAELEQTRQMQEQLLIMLGVQRPDSSAASAVADTVCDVSPGGPSAAAATEAASPPPSRWPAAGTIIREFTNGDPARRVEEHPGLDIAAAVGARVVAAADGIVEHVGTDDALGTVIEIRHGFEYLTIYGHLSRVGVTAGQHVRAGEQVANVGRSGRTATTQVHFEVWKDGVAIDPRKLLAGEPAPR